MKGMKFDVDDLFIRLSLCRFCDGYFCAPNRLYHTLFPYKTATVSA
jgi:hypothetical protein